MKIEIPRMKAAWFAKPLHTVLAVFAGFGCLWVISSIGGQIFGGGGAEQAQHTGLRHLSDMLVFGLVAFGIVGLALYVMRFTVLQAIFLPFFDELRDMAKLWREGKKPTQAEAVLALAWAIATAATILGALIAIALFATPL